MKKKTKEMNEEMNGKCKAGYITATLTKNVNQSPKGIRWLGVPDIFVKRMVTL